MEQEKIIEQSVEQALQEACLKDSLSVPPHRIEIFPAPEQGFFDYLVDYLDPTGASIGLGFRSLRPVQASDFQDPKFRVRLLHNLALWVKAQNKRQNP